MCTLKPPPARAAYTFPQVQPGRYRLEAEAPGFKKFIQSDIAIDVQQHVAIDPVLQIGQTTESIEVTAESRYCT